MSAFLLLAVCLALGVVMARTGGFPRATPAALNGWILRVALPAIVLEQVPRLSFEPTLILPALGPWMVFAGAALLFPVLGRAFGWTRGTVGALILTCGFGNTAFIGLPLIQALIGPAALGPAIIADQLGSFLVLATAGVSVAALYSGGRPEPAQIILRVLRFPPFIALLAALGAKALGGWPEVVVPVLHRLGDTLTPLALFSVGLQFRPGAVTAHFGPLSAGLAWKLLLAPLAVAATAAVAGIGGLPVTVGVLQSAMAPMITAGILAQEHDLEPSLATGVVSVGILLSFVSVPLWWLALGS